MKGEGRSMKLFFLLFNKFFILINYEKKYYKLITYI